MFPTQIKWTQLLKPLRQKVDLVNWTEAKSGNASYLDVAAANSEDIEDSGN